MEKKKITKKKATKSNKNKKKAFTLIELLAVIIILGILMVIAIPAVTSYIQNSRKSAYISTAHNIIAAARTKVNDGTLSMHDTDITYYIPYGMLKGDNEWKSPYGNFEEAYVVVTFNGNGYDYYWTSKDTTNTGIYLTYNDLLDNDRVVSDMEAINTSVGVGNRKKVVVYDNNGNHSNPTMRLDRIPERGSMPINASSIELGDSNFELDEETGTLYGIKPSFTIVIDDYNKCADYFFDEGNGGFATKADAEDFCRNELGEELLNFPDFAEELIEDEIITSYTVNSPRDIVIPEEINGVAVEVLDSGAFWGPNLETVTIPSTVQEVNFSSNDASDNLYNIINSSGRSFDWYYNNYSSDKVTFQYGVIPSPDLSKQPIIVSETKQPRITIDYENMFSIVNTGNYIVYEHCYREVSTVTLNEDYGYDIFYIIHDTDNYVKMNKGASLDIVPCIDKVKIEKNGEVYFDGLLLTSSACFC